MNTIAESEVWQALREVMDPELDCNIVDLGLVYGVTVTGAKVAVQMTLTTPGCPMGESIARGAHFALRAIPGVEEASLQVVWDPPWNPMMMSERGRAAMAGNTP